LREEYKEDAEQTQRLLKTIEMLTRQVSDITAENKKLQKEVNKLMSQISVGNKF
jgi:septal ring factor EnvC (AmiA/AmiB activator)